MIYDGEGRRRSYEDSVMIRTFIWDGENVAWQTQRAYTQAPQGYGSLISQHPTTGDGSTIFNHGDGLGSTDCLTDDTQEKVAWYRYRAFGEQTEDYAGEEIPNRYRWVGQLGYYYQPDLGTYWLRARDYAPTTGRFLSKDPVREDANRYRWPGNSPISRLDPSGMTDCYEQAHACSEDVFRMARDCRQDAKKQFVSCATDCFIDLGFGIFPLMAFLKHSGESRPGEATLDIGSIMWSIRRNWMRALRAQRNYLYMEEQSRILLKGVTFELPGWWAFAQLAVCVGLCWAEYGYVAHQCNKIVRDNLPSCVDMFYRCAKREGLPRSANPWYRPMAMYYRPYYY